MKPFRFFAAPLFAAVACALSSAAVQAAPDFSDAVNTPATGAATTKPSAPRAAILRAAKKEPWLPATIEIPALGVRAPIVRGVDNPSLRYGVGFDPDSVDIGAPGNTVIAGHRNIWGSFFWHLPRLQRGDTILIEARKTQYLYRVESSRVVKPHETHVLDSVEGDQTVRLTLYTCTRPKTTSRFIVSAKLLETRDISKTPDKSRAVAVPKKPVNKRTPPPLPALAKAVGKR